MLRHHLLRFVLPDETAVPSMALAMALKYDEDLEMPAVSSNGFWYLPYSKRQGDFEAISIADVLDGPGTVRLFLGIHVGNAVVGNTGSPRRMDYTAIGNTVNTAARLEANALGGTIYISKTVADVLTGRIIATPLTNPPKLKGKSDGFEILTRDAIL